MSYFCLNILKVVNDWEAMLDVGQPWFKNQKKRRLRKRFEKLVKGIRERHDKLVEKGCTFAKINQPAGAREHFVNHGEMCKSMGSYITGKRFLQMKNHKS